MGRDYSSVWQLNLCDSAARLSDTLIAGKPLFLDVSVKVFLKVLFSLVQWALSNTLRAWIEQKGGGKEFVFVELEH